MSQPNNQPPQTNQQNQPPQTNQPNQPTNQPNQPTNQQQQPASSSSSSFFRPPNSAPVGTITITQPPQTTTSYYKIAPNNFITFGWNFSYILIQPTSLTVNAVGENGNTYPVGPTDGVIPGTATEVVWDVYKYQQDNPNRPLVPATYTLNIFDERGPKAARSPGMLQPNSGLRFAMYTPQDYTGLADGWQCTTCSGAWSTYTTHPAFVSLMATFIIVLLSGFTLIRRNH